MKKIKYFIEYLAARVCAFFIGILPWGFLPYAAQVLGKLLEIVLTSRQKIVHENLERAFPQWSFQERQKIAGAFWRHITLVILESLKGLRESPQWFQKNVILENEEVFQEALKEEKGVLINTGHFGNWEFMGFGICSAGYPLCAIGRRQKNPYFDRWLQASRARLMAGLLNHHQAIRETQAWLKKNGCLGIVLDHNLYQGGIFVDFFGRPAATTTLTALLHLKLGSPIIGAYCWRQDGKHHVRFEKIPLNGDTLIYDTANKEDRQKRVREITQILTRKLEDWIRENPANWLWGHNRWKRKPM